MTRPTRLARGIPARWLLGLVWLLGSISGSPATLADDWPSFLGPHRDGISAETGLLTDWGDDGPPLLWRIDAGEGYAGAIVADGAVYFFDRHAGDGEGEAGTARARLRRLDPATGKTVWTTEYPSVYEDHFGYSKGPRASPTVVRPAQKPDLVVTYGVEGVLQAVRADDGEVAWRIDTLARYGVVQNFFGVGSTPWLETAGARPMLLVMVGGSPEDTPDLFSGKTTGNGTAMVALDPHSGDEIWRASTELASYSSPIVADVAGARRLFAFLRGGLQVFDPATGALQATIPHRAKKLYSVNAAAPVADGDLVLITESYEKGALQLRFAPDPDDAAALRYQVAWQDPPRRDQSLASHWSTPILVDGILYGCHGESSGTAELRAVDWRTGQARWTKRDLLRTTSIYVDDHLLVLGERGRLTLVRATADAYVEVAAAEPGLTFPAWNPPALADGVLYLRGAKELLALRVLTAPAGKQ